MKRQAMELATADERTEELNRQNEEVERRLAQLWDDNHQRQQVLEDISVNINGREMRLVAAEHSIACEVDAPGSTARHAWEAPCDVEAEHLELELTAAELSERAWRERSRALAQQELELQERLRMLSVGETTLAAMSSSCLLSPRHVFPTDGRRGLTRSNIEQEEAPNAAKAGSVRTKNPSKPEKPAHTMSYFVLISVHAWREILSDLCA
eukprot:2812689-Amphidinium_carterae.1